MTLVKICGIRSAEIALAAADAGADYLGFMFASSRRQITPTVACEVRQELRRAGYLTPTVGVFVGPEISLLSEVIAESGIEMVQLSGEENPTDFADLGIPIIKAIPAGSDETIDSIEAVMAEWWFAKHILLDASDPVARGGTGKLANWDLVHDVAVRHPVMLAGGLTPANVVEAIATTAASGADVSSGVEREGEKDATLIQRFITAAKG